MVLFWGALLATGLYFHPASPTSASAGPSAEDLLDERYARGEIDDEEYRQRLPPPSSTGQPSRTTPTRSRC
jgi:putative membrane protein